MITVKRTFFIFVILATVISSGNGQDVDYQLDKSGRRILEYIESTYADDCDTGNCKNAVCNCCPGYGVKESKVFGDSCKKCDCGKDFGCKFTGWFDTRTCICPDGYAAISDVCKADCKKNPCKNNGKCKVSGNNIVCNCAYGYIGEFCEKIPTTPSIPDTKMKTESISSSAITSETKTEEDETTIATTTVPTTPSIPDTKMETESITSSVITSETKTAEDETTIATTTEAFEFWIQIMKKFRMKDSESSMNISYLLRKGRI